MLPVSVAGKRVKFSTEFDVCNLFVVCLAIFEYSHLFKCAVLDAVFGVGKTASTIFPKGVQGTIAEQTVKIFRVSAIVARKIFLSASLCGAPVAPV